jgi:hypothetical protein
MYKAIAAMILAAGAAFLPAPAAKADETPKAAQKAAPKTAQKNATAGRALTLPKDAVKNPDGTYAWTDTQSTKWIYSKTAAGYTRSTAAAVQAARVVVIPKDAAAGPDGSFLWTDKAGKKWAFWNTPFGVVKNPVADPAPPSAAAAAADSLTKVVDKGDTVRFERTTPFGISGYEKQKSDLNEDERRLYEASRAKPE